MKRLFLSLPIRGILLLLIISLYQNIVFSQQDDISDKFISMPEYKGSVKKLFDILSEKENIVFAYSSEINLTFEVTTKKEEVSLKLLLDNIFKNSAIDYQIKGNKVLLYNTNKNEPKPVGLKQTIRGTIYDRDAKIPLIGVTVIIPGSDPVIGTVTDARGNFRLENILIGRVDLQFSYMGYEAITISNIEVLSAKEAILNLEMQESALKLDEVVVGSGRKKGEALNELTILSARSISVEETKRYTAGMDDPARMVTSYAGVMASDGSSDIIVRGNSPKYMQWQLDGIEISSPYHIDDQNAAFGALTALNKSLMGTSDFYTGAFTSEYGNVLSNIMNLRLRPGNNEKFEAALGIGLLGTDLTVEGPFKKGYSGSYLINYRYSSVALMNDLGLLGDIDGVVNYQDATFKVVLPTKNAGTFSIFGLGGLSGFSFENLTPGGIATPGMDRDVSIIKDYDKVANLSNLAFNNTKTISDNSYIRTSISYSANGFTDDLYEKKNNEITLDNNMVENRLQTFESSVKNSAYRAALNYHNRINAHNRIQVGSRYCYNLSEYNQNFFLDSIGAMVNVTDFNKSFQTVSNFISWKYSLNHRIAFVSGLHNMNMFLNSKSTLEPRLALSWMLNASSSIHAGYGKHSRTENMHNYFVRIQQPDGSYTKPNKNLDMLKADHFVLGYQKYFTDLLVAKFEVYYQHLYNLPVENNDTSYYATINEGYDYRYVPLVNKGVGKNYGVEFTLERFFDNNYYLVFNSSLYESKYKSLEGIWRNTKYNGNYIVNFLGGKEFKNIGRKSNNVLAINAKAILAGAQRYIPLLRDSEGNIAVDPDNNRYWDYGKAYDNELVHFYNLNVSVSYKINKLKTTHEIFLDLMNIVNSNARLSEYYDVSKPDKIGYTKQMFFLPNIMYRVYF